MPSSGGKHSDCDAEITIMGYSAGTKPSQESSISYQLYVLYQYLAVVCDMAGSKSAHDFTLLVFTQHLNLSP